VWQYPHDKKFRGVGAMVARPPPERKVGCSSHSPIDTKINHLYIFAYVVMDKSFEFFNINTLANREMLQNSPSRKDGLSFSEEEDFRRYGSILIQSSGILLKLPQVVTASASVLFQRIYCILSFKEFPIRNAVLGCLFLATKTGESLRKIKDIISVVDLVIKKDRDFPTTLIDCGSQKFLDLRDDLLTAEMMLLRNLAFSVHVQLPYGLLVSYMQCLGLESNQKPNVIACAAIYLACNLYAEPLPKSTPWYLIFDVDYKILNCLVLMIINCYASKVNKTLPITSKELDLYFDDTSLYQPSQNTHINSENPTEVVPENKSTTAERSFTKPLGDTYSSKSIRHRESSRDRNKDHKHSRYRSRSPKRKSEYDRHSRRSDDRYSEHKRRRSRSRNRHREKDRDYNKKEFRERK
ncbi:hypothetical protein BB560_004269, partial [Smittium megazygosporum]